MSVPPRFSNRGIGKKLVSAAESHILHLAQAHGSVVTKAVMEMGVINQREDLFPWYQRQGYVTIGPLPHDAELNRIVLEGMDVYCVLMQKQLI